MKRLIGACARKTRTVLTHEQRRRLSLFVAEHGARQSPVLLGVSQQTMYTARDGGMLQERTAERLLVRLGELEAQAAA